MRVDTAEVPRFGIGHWYGLGVVIVSAAVILAAIAIGLAVQGGARTRSTLLDHVDPAVLASGRLSNAISAQVAEIRSFAQTGTQADAAYFRRDRTDETAAIAEMTRLLRGVPRSGPTIIAMAGVRSAMDSWRHAYAEPLIVSRTGDRPSPTFGEERFAPVRTALTDLRARLTELHHDAAGRLRGQVGDLYAALAAGAAVLAVGTAGLTWLIRRTVLQPVTALTEQVRRVSQGDLTYPLRVAGPAEIAELSTHVDAMRNHILEEWQEALEARAKLDEQAAELRRSNAELEQFAYVASHDLQEPLRKVASFCQMLDRRYADALDDRGKQYIGFAVDGAKRMQALINDLLNFSRVGRVNRDMTVVCCEQALETALDNLGLARSESDAAITWGPLPEVTGDRTLLTQLFQNLIGNAMKFHSADPPVIHISVRRDDAAWEFACTDNGIGIDAAYADRIFLIFQRLHPKEEYSGTGIGLALCKKIVEYHGGHIWLATEPDKPGTTIRWTLPAIDDPESAE